MEVVELVERCKKGERKAQALLYKTYSHKMLGICFRFVTDRQIAQDLMHDGFILIFSSLGSLRHPGKVRKLDESYNDQSCIAISQSVSCCIRNTTFRDF